ncbi:hypothetical protein LWC34_35600 [Kibdelosporangium philippinense]|uniref:Uncharacterized protein n=1 Tax=Kibdelosporangium philippinense TaxID=211113 RepID=A0ABS8ZKW9_9PSEU|nr:hypothetical protein [Kibdelosporangium philippinense]MCE7008109.1 hypothetical protein [Kibdelosporangium philippinense]
MARGTVGRIRLIDARGGIVGIREQAKYSSTPLAQFLDDRLPHRDAIVESWTQTLLTAPDDSPRLDREHDSVGWALELRLGLDLANAPARRQELSYLPIDRCTQLLTAAGFQHTPVGTLPASGTSDPILLHWSRTHHPVCLDDAQRAALTTCLDLASFRQPMHRWGETKTVDARRAFFAAIVGEDDYGHDTHLLDAFAHYWTVYFTCGRPRLAALGDRVIIAPELGNGFGIADLVIGNTLVDVKLVAQPTTTAVHTWLRQLLGYVLLDHHNALHINAIAIYSGHNAQLKIFR